MTYLFVSIGFCSVSSTDCRVSCPGHSSFRTVASTGPLSSTTGRLSVYEPVLCDRFRKPVGAIGREH